jgi:GntR family transcriptional regulator / MocR family aminotransferase
MQPSDLVISEDCFHKGGGPRYEQLANWIERLIRERNVLPGERLPTVRELSRTLNVSATTVTSAFLLLEKRKIISAEVGRGTFVSKSLRVGEAPLASDSEVTFSRGQLRPPSPAFAWRRRTLMALSSRLRATFPSTIDCSTGRPDPELLPFSVIQRAWNCSMRKVAASDLQYAGPEPIVSLREHLVRRLSNDGVPVRPQDLLICDSAQQAITLTMEILASEFPHEPITIAVEEPGYPTMLDTLERSRFQMIGLAMDEFGVVPESLEEALRAGAHSVFFTPRAQNPTGASWSVERRVDLANVLALHPRVLILEDDQFAEVASTRPGSLLADTRLENNVVYVRSFSKSVAPDLRIAAIAARPSLLEKFFEVKSFSDGWTSRLIQRVLSNVFADEEFEPSLDAARTAYELRRHNASRAANSFLVPAGGGTWPGMDGLNIWVHLPPGRDAREVIELSAAAGLQLAEGEPFYISQGHHNVLRLNAGSVSPEMATRAGNIVGESCVVSNTLRGPIYV